MPMPMPMPMPMMDLFQAAAWMFTLTGVQYFILFAGFWREAYGKNKAKKAESNNNMTDAPAGKDVKREWLVMLWREGERAREREREKGNREGKREKESERERERGREPGGRGGRASRRRDVILRSGRSNRSLSLFVFICCMQSEKRIVSMGRLLHASVCP